MRESIYEASGGTYTRSGDYLLPDLLPAESEHDIGPWGLRHLNYLRKNRRITYTNLLTAGKLWAYLAEIDRQANSQLEGMITQMAAAEGITESLKAKDQMEWVRSMNSIRSRAEEQILTELIMI